MTVYTITVTSQTTHDGEVYTAEFPSDTAAAHWELQLLGRLRRQAGTLSRLDGVLAREDGQPLQPKYAAIDSVLGGLIRTGTDYEALAELTSIDGSPVRVELAK